MIGPRFYMYIWPPLPFPFSDFNSVSVISTPAKLLHNWGRHFFTNRATDVCSACKRYNLGFHLHYWPHSISMLPFQPCQSHSTRDKLQHNLARKNGSNFATGSVNLCPIASRRFIVISKRRWNMLTIQWTTKITTAIITVKHCRYRYYDVYSRPLLSNRPYAMNWL